MKLCKQFFFHSSNKTTYAFRLNDIIHRLNDLQSQDFLGSYGIPLAEPVTTLQKKLIIIDLCNWCM